MSIDPIRRRFGAGAARLPMSGSATRTLSRAAQQPTRFELVAASVPTLVTAVLAGLLSVAVAWPDPAKAPAAEPTRVQQWAVQPPPSAPPQPLASSTPRSAEAPAAPPAPQENRIAASAPPAEPPGTSPESSNVPGGMPMPVLGRVDFQDPATARNGPRPAPSSQTARDRRARPQAQGRPGALERHLQMAGTEPGTFESADESSGMPASAAALRPAVRPAAAHTHAPRGASDWTAAASRTEFIAETARPSPEAVPAAVRGRRPPPVAAARPQALSAGAPGLPGAFGAGWEEVPLDGLPDCSPPGRQDQLKQAILRKAAKGSECAGQAADYRFVETRNLGAFLLWARVGDRSRARPGPTEAAPRDACDVLEAALRCLREENTGRPGNASPGPPSNARGTSAPRDLIRSLTPKEESFIR